MASFQIKNLDELKSGARIEVSELKKKSYGFCIMEAI